MTFRESAASPDHVKASHQGHVGVHDFGGHFVAFARKKLQADLDIYFNV